MNYDQIPSLRVIYHKVRHLFLLEDYFPKQVPFDNVSIQDNLDLVTILELEVSMIWGVKFHISLAPRSMLPYPKLPLTWALDKLQKKRPHDDDDWCLIKFVGDPVPKNSAANFYQRQNGSLGLLLSLLLLHRGQRATISIKFPVTSASGPRCPATSSTEADGSACPLPANLHVWDPLCDKLI